MLKVDVLIVSKNQQNITYKSEDGYEFKKATVGIHVKEPKTDKWNFWHWDDVEQCTESDHKE